MSYPPRSLDTVALALYRKYRPATFAEVVGQEHVTDPLRKALAAGRINHAYLFSGPRGCGKTSSARILARSLNCVTGPTPDPCGECAPCLALAPEGPGSLDVVELDAASHGGVDDTRELRDRAFYMPSESRYRVFIIDEAHMVSNQGFNALLKIVEEPPEHVVFVFATTEPEKVLPTIRSRTHHYPFHLLPPTVLRGLLEKLCGEEGVAVEPAVYPLVVRAGAGSARDALSVMDQLLAGAGPEGVTYASAVALLGVTDSALLDQMVDALAAADGESVFGAIELVAQAGHDPRRFGADLLQRLRDLVILQAVPDAAEKGLVDEPADQLAAMVAQAGRLPVATLTRFAEVLHSGLSEMRGTTSPRLVLELLAARMLLPAASLDDAGLLQRLERVERRLDIALDGDDAGSGSRDAGSTGTERPPAAGRSSGAAAAEGARAAAERSVAAERGPAAERTERPVSSSSRGAVSRGGAPESGAPEPAADAPAAERPPRAAANAGVDLGLPTPPVLSSMAKAVPKPAAGTRVGPGAGDDAASSGADSAGSAAGSGSGRAVAHDGAVESGADAPAGTGERRPAAASSGADGVPSGAEAAAGATASTDDGVPDGNGVASEGAATGGSDASAGAPEAAAGEVPSSMDGAASGPPPGAGADVGVNDVRRLWPQVLEMIKGRNRRTHALLESAALTIVKVDGGVLSVSTQFAALARMISEPGNANLVSDALRELLGVDWRLRCSEEGAASGPADTSRSSPPAQRTTTSGAERDRSAERGAPRAASGQAAGSRGGTQVDEAPADAEPDRGPADDGDARGAALTADEPVTRTAGDDGGTEAGWGATADGDVVSRNSAGTTVSAHARKATAASTTAIGGDGRTTRATSAGGKPASAPREFTRPARDVDVPEPPPEDDYDPYSEIDPEAGPDDASSYQVVDPSKLAIELLTAKLGARPITGPNSF